MQTVDGQCHCANIRYALSWADDCALTLRGRACRCGYCRMHGALWTSHPDAALTVDINDRARVIEYRFGHETATFHVCGMCGLLPFASCDIDGELFAVSNVQTFTTIDAAAVPRSEANFEDERIEARLARRRQTWSPLTYARLAP